MKLLIIDGNSVLYRAYYAMPDWRNKSGEATSGVYGFLSMLIRAIENLKPTHLIVVFDSAEGINFRKELYVGYQANRDKDEEVFKDINGQSEKLGVVFEKLAVPVYRVPNFEADDVIGTITKKVHKENEDVEIIIATGDRDLMQLVDKTTHLYMPQKGVSDAVEVDEDKVVERLGVKPSQVIDYKAMAGDASDGYPGVVGVGPKTASTLLEKFGTFEKILKEALAEEPSAEISKGVVEKFKQGKDGGVLSYTLATIRTDVPLKLDLEEAVLPGEEKMVEVFKELGHKSLIRRLTGEEIELDDSQQKLFE